MDPYAGQYGMYPSHPAPPSDMRPAAPYVSPSDEVRTIFISGFPEDMKEREVNNLLRFLPGYAASQITWKNGQAQGFALFDTGSQSRNAIDAIAHVEFDDASTLRAEMARKNMFVKDDTKRARSGPASNSAPYATQPSYESQAPAGGSSYPAAGGPLKDNPPCSTLYVGNLGETISETELTTVFGSQAGFKQLKINNGARGINCFVEFGDLASAMAVHQALQGTVLTSSDRGPIRIQYSKSPLGMKRGGPQQPSQY
jgi:hypothetical protein